MSFKLTVTTKVLVIKVLSPKHFCCADYIFFFSVCVHFKPPEVHTLGSLVFGESTMKE